MINRYNSSTDRKIMSHLDRLNLRLKKILFSSRARFLKALYPSVYFQPQNGMLLSGSPRSGTTYLGRILSGCKNYCMVTEPIDYTQTYIQQVGFSERTYVPADKSWPEGVGFFKGLYHGRNIGKYQLMDNSVGDILFCNSILTKCVRANRLVPWLSANLNLRAYIYLIRHPCAVVASQIRHTKFSHRTTILEDDRIYLEVHMPSQLRFANSLSTEEEVRALTWCLDQYIPLNSPRKEKWLQVSYEQIVIHGNAKIKQILDNFRLCTSPKSMRRAQENSREAQRWSVDHRTASVEKRLSLWKNILDRGQVRRILNVVDRIGIGGFSDDIVPSFNNIGIS